jgi:hypothetical protein
MKRTIQVAAGVVLVAGAAAGCTASPVAHDPAAPDAASMDGGQAPPDTTGRGPTLGSGY